MWKDISYVPLFSALGAQTLGADGAITIGGVAMAKEGTAQETSGITLGGGANLILRPSAAAYFDPTASLNAPRIVIPGCGIPLADRCLRSVRVRGWIRIASANFTASGQGALGDGIAIGIMSNAFTGCDYAQVVCKKMNVGPNLVAHFSWIALQGVKYDQQYNTDGATHETLGFIGEVGGDWIQGLIALGSTTLLEAKDLTATMASRLTVSGAASSPMVYVDNASNHKFFVTAYRSASSNVFVPEISGWRFQYHT